MFVNTRKGTCTSVEFCTVINRITVQYIYSDVVQLRRDFTQKCTHILCSGDKKNLIICCIVYSLPEISC